MASTKPEQKTVLLLSPLRLMEDHITIESLHIIRSANTIDYQVNALDAGEVRRCYPKLPKPVKDALLWFAKEGIDNIESRIKAKHKAQRSGISLGVYYHNSMLREMHMLFEQLKPFAALFKWYHKIKGEKGYFKTAPCVFSTYKPRLQFEVIKTAAGLELKTHISINNTAYTIEQFSRYYFLLESGGEYFLLGFKDFQTLEWLEQNDPIQYAGNAQQLAEHILTRLEEDYTVNRNNLFEQHIIATEPVKRVMLSEISGSFLVLTPQWLYDGFLIEGNYKEQYETVKQGEAYVIKRNQEAEAAFVKQLEALHPNFSKQFNGYYYLSFAEAQKKQWFLKVYHSLLEQNIQLSGMDMLTHFRYSPHKVETDLEIKENNDNSLQLKLRISFGNEEVPLNELQKMLLNGQRAILLKDGSLGVLSEEWIKQYGTIIKHGKVQKKEIQVARWMALTEQQATAEGEVLKPVLKNDWWQKWQQWQQPESVVYHIPQSVQVQSLRPYQQKGYEWLMLLAEAGSGACLADDMGLGKTLQTICFLVNQLEKNRELKHLVVCPSSLIYNWQQELQKFAPHIQSIAYHGASRQFDALQANDHQVIITSYGTLRSDIEKMASMHFNVVVVDESHNIKNPAALITRAVNQLNAITRVALSGTPVMNNTFDLYAQLNFLLPGMFGSREFFKREYADAIDRDRDEEKIKALQKLTAPFILRRTKEQVATDLPEKTEIVLWCEMSGAQREQYEEIKGKIRSSVFLNIKQEGFAKSKLALLQGITRLRQVCNSPLLLPVEERNGIPDSIKIDMLMDELKENLQSQKVLIFSQFSSMLDLISEACHKNGIAHYHFDGQTPSHQRMEMVNNFQQEGNTTNVFLISLMAGNAGLNLTAASYVFLIDPWWNKAVEQQAIDRTHRIGQTKSVFAYKMVCKDTIEEKIIHLQMRKKKLAEELVGEEDGFVKNLSEDDIEYLFS